MHVPDAHQSSSCMHEAWDASGKGVRLEVLSSWAHPAGHVPAGLRHILRTGVPGCVHALTGLNLPAIQSTQGETRCLTTPYRTTKKGRLSGAGDPTIDVAHKDTAAVGSHSHLTIKLSGVAL